MPRPSRPGVTIAGLVLAALVTAGACGRDDAPVTGGRATGRFGAVHTEVCAAAAAAKSGDTAAAGRRFDDVHQGLHDLAAATEDTDRAAAARLLEAKQRAEAEPTAEHLAALVAPVAAAVERTGGTAPANCP